MATKPGTTALIGLSSGLAVGTIIFFAMRRPSAPPVLTAPPQPPALPPAPAPAPAPKPANRPPSAVGPPGPPSMEQQPAAAASLGQELLPLLPAVAVAAEYLLMGRRNSRMQRSDADQGNPNTASYEGRLLRATGTAAIYLISGGMKHYIPDMATFQSNGFNLADVLNVDTGVLASIPTGAPLASTGQNDPNYAQAYEGRLLKVVGTAPIYLIYKGSKHWIPTQADLNDVQSRFQVYTVTQVPSDVLSTIPDGVNYT